MQPGMSACVKCGAEYPTAAGVHPNCPKGADAAPDQLNPDVVVPQHIGTYQSDAEPEQ